MTKFDVMEEKLLVKRAERRNEELNRRLAISLSTKTHAEVVAELFSSLTVILGVGDVQTEKTFAL